MAPSLSTSSAATLRIPLRRFATQVFFSVLATLIPNLLQKWDILPISGFIVLYGVAYTDLALAFRDPLAKPRSPYYSIPLGMSLGYLHQITTAIGERLLDSSSGFSQTQHVAFHFCLAFFIISEFEFYRAYSESKNFEPSLNVIKHFILANVDPNHVFPVSRDPWGFGYGYMTLFPGPDLEMTWKYCGLNIGQWLLFWINSGLANILLKRMVDPSSNYGEVLLWAMTSTCVLFTTEDLWLLLNVPLLRVVRQANHVGFWTFVEVMEWWEARAEAHDEYAGKLLDV